MNGGCGAAVVPGRGLGVDVRCRHNGVCQKKQGKPVTSLSFFSFFFFPGESQQRFAKSGRPGCVSYTIGGRGLWRPVGSSAMLNMTPVWPDTLRLAALPAIHAHPPAVVVSSAR